jgi:ABC-type antimicrobial peptide transport system permease subunit
LQSFNPDESVLVPASVMDARIGEGDAIDRVSEIVVRVVKGADPAAVSVAVAALLRRRHAGAADRYEMVVPRELLRARLRAQRTFDAVMLATGFIALVISGVGIMNVMLAAAAEREPEIGVRRAFGARRMDIVQQFALEAALLCLAGGVAGIPVGGLLAWTVSLLAAWPVALSAGSVSLALALAVGVGLAFGIYPAYRAASTDPIVALRA